MAFILRVPTSVSQLHENLEQLYKNKGHIGSVKVNESASHLEVDLDWSANHLGGEAGQDFSLPIKRGKLRDAKILADKLLSSNSSPTRSEATELYDMIDPQLK